MRQPASIAIIIGILQTFVLTNRRAVGQMHPVARLHQTVHQPVPVVGGLNHQTFDGLLPRLQCPYNTVHIIR